MPNRFRIESELPLTLLNQKLTPNSILVSQIPVSDAFFAIPIDFFSLSFSSRNPYQVMKSLFPKKQLYFNQLILVVSVRLFLRTVAFSVEN